MGEAGRLRGADSHGAAFGAYPPSSMLSLTGGSAVSEPYRQAIVATVHRALWLRSGLAWLQCRATPGISGGTAHCSHAGSSQAGGDGHAVVVPASSIAMSVESWADFP